jgi:1-aminocyclopropane-1-carboxylate deaminase/D-cysteine desulfhydrase-like pyridoxal-dependent ACC family enzyme
MGNSVTRESSSCIRAAEADHEIATEMPGPHAHSFWSKDGRQLVFSVSNDRAYGCANRLGAIGYVNAALEIADQLAEQYLPGTGRRLTRMLLPSGTGGTQAGLLLGLAALNLPIKVIGVDIDADPPGVRGRVSTLVVELAHQLELDPTPIINDIASRLDSLAGGYGHADPATLDAVRAAAQLEGLTLDSVYTGKPWPPSSALPTQATSLQPTQCWCYTPAAHPASTPTARYSTHALGHRSVGP